MGDYLGGYFSQKFFDSEIYDILIQVPEVSGYLAAEWSRFKNDKTNKVPKDAKMSKIWAKKEIFNNRQLRVLTESLILGKYDVELDDNGHITKDTPRPIKERKKIDTRGFYELLEGLKNTGRLNDLQATPEEFEQTYKVPKYFQEKIAKMYAPQASQTYRGVEEQKSPLEKIVTNIKEENIFDNEKLFDEPTGSKEEKLIQMADELIAFAEEIKRILRS